MMTLSRPIRPDNIIQYIKIQVDICKTYMRSYTDPLKT